jgi:hypothetical protein
MPKTPNFVQKPTGVYQYPAPLKLPPMTNYAAPSRNPALPARINQNAPAPPVVGHPQPGTAKAPARPLGPMTNQVNQVRK